MAEAASREIEIRLCGSGGQGLLVAGAILAVLDPQEIARAAAILRGARKILVIGVGTSAPNANDAAIDDLKPSDETPVTQTIQMIIQQGLIGAQ